MQVGEVLSGRSRFDEATMSVDDHTGAVAVAKL